MRRKSGVLNGKKRREDFTVTYNEDSAEAENSPWQSGHSRTALRGGQRV